MVAAAVVALVAMVAGGLMAWGAWMRSQRQSALPRVATAAGLEYCDVDPFNSIAVPFALFRAGDGRTVENIMWRNDANGRPVRVFDYSWFSEHRTNTGTERSWHHHTCATAQHNGPWPAIEIDRQRLLDRVGQRLGARTVELESEEFNRTFTVRCDDPRFATILLSPQMMHFLLETEGKISFASKGRFALAAAPRLDASLMPALLAVIETFVTLIPPVVFELYGRSPDGAGTETMPAPPFGRPDEEAVRVTGPIPDWGLNGFEFAPPPDRDALDALDPTPGVEHDLDGRVVEAREDPWGEGRPLPGPG